MGRMIARGSGSENPLEMYCVVLKEHRPTTDTFNPDWILESDKKKDKN